MSGPRHLFLIDGSGFIFRAFHALPPLTRPDGTPVGAVYGFTQMILKLLEETDADAVAVVFDAGRETFRNEIYPDYKANRPPPPDDLIPQFALVREATRAFNVPAVELAGFEADDLIATYARLAAEAGAEVTIVSADKDLMQLVGGKVSMMDPIKTRRIGPEEVRERFGVTPEKVVEVQALAGDSTDNVPGVPGIGVKTAAELINEYGDLDNLLAHAGEIKQPKRRERLQENADLARISRQLVRLKDDVPVDEPLEVFTLKEPDPGALLGFLEQQEFKSLLARVRARLAEGGHLVDHVTETKQQSKPDAAAGGGYALVQDEAALQAWVDAARRQGVVAVATETTSLAARRSASRSPTITMSSGPTPRSPAMRRRFSSLLAGAPRTLRKRPRHPLRSRMSTSASVGVLEFMANRQPHFVNSAITAPAPGISVQAAARAPVRAV